MVLNTTRFGKVEYSEEEILHMPEGLLGFQDLKSFLLLEDPRDEIFMWLQSVSEPSIAFPILEPELFLDHYSPQLARSDLIGLDFKTGDVLRVLCIVTIPDDPTQMTANLKAPVVVNLRNHYARQCVLQDNQLAIREPIFEVLQRRVISGNWPTRRRVISEEFNESQKDILKPIVADLQNPSGSQ